MKEKDMIVIAGFIDTIVNLGIKIQKISGTKINDFNNILKKEENMKIINEIKNEVKIFVNQFEFY